MTPRDECSEMIQAIIARLEAPRREAEAAYQAAERAKVDAYNKANPHNPCDGVIDGAMALGGALVVGAFWLLVILALAAVAF